MTLLSHTDGFSTSDFQCAGLRRDCGGIAAGLRRDCGGIAAGLPRDCGGIAAGLRRDCGGIVAGSPIFNVCDHL